MEFELKSLTKKSIPRSLERAEHYRLLNEPEQAESICLDVLEVDPENQQALVNLLLAITDQFGADHSGTAKKARKLLPRLKDDYQRIYYAGIISERRARALLEQRAPASSFAAYDRFRLAMESYEKALEIRPAGNDDALLRWNTCARTIMDQKLRPAPADEFQPFLE